MPCKLRGARFFSEIGPFYADFPYVFLVFYQKYHQKSKSTNIFFKMS